jgi:beta-lactamase superfamily II metal-dependent hydrolase
MIQVAHHGSRHNADNEILDRLLGKADGDAPPVRTAVISASKDAPKHPSAKIVNEYKLRRCRLVSTESGGKRHGHYAPPRVGWVPAAELPFMQDDE